MKGKNKAGKTDKKNIVLKKEAANKISYQMLFFIIIISVILGFFVWNFFIEKQASLESRIPSSDNVDYKSLKPIAINVNDFIQEFESNKGKPILLYLYTTWCSTCKKDLAKINEVARFFQNTDLRVMIIAIDNNIDPENLKDHLATQQKLYFLPKYLSYREGLINFLDRKGVKYRLRIPFTALISADGKVITQFSGAKSERYFKSKIIKTLSY